MKAISLWEPWASLIAVGAKKFETRSWATSYRGPLLICASKGGLSRLDLQDFLAVKGKQGLFEVDDSIILTRCATSPAVQGGEG